MNKKRLLALADYLETIPAKKFDIGVFATGKEHNYKTTKNKKMYLECGTVACALGWMPSSPKFRRDGWTLKISKWLSNDVTKVATPLYRGLYGFDAAKEYFDINYDESVQLFSSDSYRKVRKVTPKMVAKKIRKFVA